MRIICDHKKDNCHNTAIQIKAIDTPGQDGMSLVYQITLLDGEGETSYTHVLRFQSEDAVGVTDEALLAVVLDRLRGIQSGNLANCETAHALIKIEEALMRLGKRE